MNAPRGLPEQLSTGRVNDHPVPVHLVHRRWAAAAPGGDYEPVLVTVTTPIALSLDDAAAVLADGYGWEPVEDMDDDTVRELIAGIVTSEGCFRVDELRYQARNLDPGSEDATYLASCRQRVAAVFGPPSRPRDVSWWGRADGWRRCPGHGRSGSGGGATCSTAASGPDRG